MNRRVLIAVFVTLLGGIFGDVQAGRIESVDYAALRTPVYAVEGDAFVRHNGERYCNRPLYCNQIAAVALGGDKPYVLVGGGKSVFGNLMIAVVRDGKGKWLQDAANVTAKYRPGRMEWLVRDPAWGDTTVQLEAVPTAEGAGVAVHLHVSSASAGEEIIWASGAAFRTRGSVLYDFDMTIPHPVYSITRGFVPGDCAGNLDQFSGDGWTLSASAGAPMGIGECSAASYLVVADAGAWRDPLALRKSSGSNRPIVCGDISLPGLADVYWCLKESGGEHRSAAQEFAAGMKRAGSIEGRVVVDTPDPWLNAVVGASSAAIDGVFRNGMFTHAGMRWSVPLLGWRTMFGGTVYGWHDRVKAQSELCIGKQITESDKTEAVADPKTLLSSQAADSRLFGKGRIGIYQPNHYDMQSQFFDQVQHAWRWTGDAELGQLLSDSLDLQCEYMKECFDPNDLGIYESYANSWPTDDQWYDGGGTSEETAYTYRAERTALELARRRGDTHGIEVHSAAVAKIRTAFFDLLWSPTAGHPGAYREQGGLNRLHESCWLYSIFCPIDAGLLDREQSAEALNYTETELERVHLPYGGEQCWPSNWVPSIWSVREMWPGDNYQLALAYFQTGLAEEGWSILRGTFPQHSMFGTVPADMGAPAGATDFNDCDSMFARAVVEGLFGYVPDYADGKVVIRPEFPREWDHAGITTPDVAMKWSREGVVVRCGVHLMKGAGLEVDLPVSTSEVEWVTADGKGVRWELSPGFGCSVVKVKTPAARDADIEVKCRDVLPSRSSEPLFGLIGSRVMFAIPGGSVIDFHDPQGVLTQAKISNGNLEGVLSANEGDHVVFGLVQIGKTTQWRMFKVHVIAAARENADDVRIPPAASWETVDMQPVFNGDVRKLFEQKYASPRPNTCSLRLATDGYGTWQMVLQKNYRPPEIGLENLAKLRNEKGNICTGEGVPFAWASGPNNIAFTSLWDNWPKRVEVPVEKGGDAVWFMVCGSTNPMQVRIANAEIELNYADGVVEEVALVPPMNFWALCPIDGIDYDYARDGFALPKVPPRAVQLGKNCRAILLGHRLRAGVELKSVSLKCLSQEVVIGLMGVTVMQAQPALH
jgi:hypothetical protein